mgnify:FL=1
MTLPLPSHFDPARAGDLWVERPGLLAERGRAWAERHGVRPAADDRRRIAAFGIDAQVSFCHPDGGLFVPGAVEDTARTAAWLYRNLDRITEVVMSLDTHELHQIFHPAFWTDVEGQPPAPLTAITAEEVRSGRWRPTQASAEDALEYCERLEATGKYVLTIWPYHGLLGGVSHAVLPTLGEAVWFQGFCRRTQPRWIVKGRTPMTEMYSVLSPEVQTVGGRPLGGFDRDTFEHLRRFDRVYVFGQASSHCVLATLEDLAEALEAEDPALLQRVVILEDAMSPVPAPPLDPLPPELDFPRVARRRLDALVERGMRRARTTDPLGD